MRSWSVELGKHDISVDETLDRALEQHEDHHNAENLKAVSGHVHHDRVHGNLLGWGDGDLPRFLELQSVGLFGILLGRLLLLLLLLVNC
jgi:hypothetical protein